VTRLLALVLMAAVVFAWARGPDGEVPACALVFLVSLSVVSLVRLDQMMSVVGLAALTVAIWAQRHDRCLSSVWHWRWDCRARPMRCRSW
jgi:hypothetical protein